MMQIWVYGIYRAPRCPAEQDGGLESFVANQLSLTCNVQLCGQVTECMQSLGYWLSLLKCLTSNQGSNPSWILSFQPNDLALMLV